MRTRIREKTGLLMVYDLAAMLLAFSIAIAFGHRPPVSIYLFEHYKEGIAVLVLSQFIVFNILDLYSLHRMGRRFLQQSLFIATGLIISAIPATVIFFFIRSAVIPRAVLLIFLLFSFIFITLFRYHYSRRNISRIFWKILIVGDQKAGDDIGRLISGRAYLHSRLVGYISDAAPASPPSVAYLGRMESLPSIVESEGIDEVIVTHRRIDEGLMNHLIGCMQKRVRVSDFIKVTEEISEKVPVEYLDGYWFLLELSKMNKKYFWFAKRFADIVVGFIGIFISIAILPLVVILLKLDSRGPVFYSQMRVGRSGKHFKVWKLRTMVVDADKNNVHWTTEKDNRITRVGGFLRKVRLDEFPQFFNILRGDMSLIGPRPEAVSLAELYARKIPHYNERHIVTPGITGWAQINYPYGNSVEDAREKLKYDFYYIKNRSILLDLIIFLRTIRTVLTGKGAI